MTCRFVSCLTLVLLVSSDKLTDAPQRLHRTEQEHTFTTFCIVLICKLVNQFFILMHILHKGGESLSSRVVA